MSTNSKIEWCDHTFNPWIGCTRISPGCDRCYAAVSTPARVQGVVWGPASTRLRTSKGNWALPRRWNAQHQAFFNQYGHRQRVFCASLADVFDNAVDPEWRSELFMLISETPHLDWLILTKRIGSAWKMMADACGVSIASLYLPLKNVWMGATIVNQEEADRDIPKLLTMPASKRFLSMEPLLGPVDLTRLTNPGPLHQPGAFINALRGGTWGEVAGTGERLRITHGPLGGIDWVIAGGESGPGARPMHPDWARDLRDQCAAAGVPFHFKQWGEWRSICQGGGDWYQPLYRSRKKAGVDESQAVLDDVWGRDCTVPELCLRNNGQHAGISEPGAWMQGLAPVHAFKVGKKAAGRLLDGIEHNGFPEGS